MKVESGTGNGKWAKVDDNNRLETLAVSNPYQHSISKTNGQAYQVWGTTDISNGTVNTLHIKNTSSDKDLTITYIRNQLIDIAGGAPLPYANCYFDISSGLTFSSGGSSKTPVNVHIGNGNVAEVTAYDSDPTLSGSATVLERIYATGEGDHHTLNKEGSLIIDPGQSLTFRFSSNGSSGTVYTRVSFLMEDIND